MLYSHRVERVSSTTVERDGRAAIEDYRVYDNSSFTAVGTSTKQGGHAQ